jgi:anti-anti-sigma regulatory factor
MAILDWLKSHVRIRVPRNEQSESDASVYERISVKNERGAMVVSFLSPRIQTETEVQQVGRELISVLDDAARTRAPLVVSFRGVEAISSAFIGKLVVFHKRAKNAGVPYRLAEISPAVHDVFLRIWPGDGPAGVVAVLKPPPKNDGGRAFPPVDGDNEQ